MMILTESAREVIVHILKIIQYWTGAMQGSGLGVKVVD